MKKLAYILLEINIIAHLVMMLFSCENSMENIKMFIDNDTIVGLMAYDVVIERSDSGRMVARLEAPMMISIDDPDSAKLEFPKGFTAYMIENDSLTSMIRGDYGVNYEKKELVLAKHNVVVKNLNTKEVMETERLFWDQKKKMIYTGCLVKISGPDKLIYGDSMIAREDFSKRELFGITATIEIDEDE